VFLRHLHHSDLSFWCLKGVIFELGIGFPYNAFVIQGDNSPKHLYSVILYSPACCSDIFETYLMWKCFRSYKESYWGPKDKMINKFNKNSGLGITV